MDRVASNLQVAVLRLHSGPTTPSGGPLTAQKINKKASQFPARLFYYIFLQEVLVFLLLLFSFQKVNVS
jgi:hypothetical protein